MPLMSAASLLLRRKRLVVTAFEPQHGGLYEYGLLPKSEGRLVCDDVCHTATIPSVAGGYLQLPTRSVDCGAQGDDGCIVE